MTDFDFPQMLLDAYGVFLGPAVEAFFIGQAPLSAYGVVAAGAGFLVLSRWAHRKA